MGTETFDVFLSYNSKDRQEVVHLAELLRSLGLQPWLDTWELLPGRRWQEAIERGLLKSYSVAVLVGSSGIGPWQEPEMRAVLSESVSRELPVIPVLLPGCPDMPQLPLFLRGFTWVDLRRGFTDDGVARLIWGITGRKPEVHAVDPASERDIRAPIARYSLDEVFKTDGMPALTYIEPDIYGLVADSVMRPGRHVLVQGSSGSGKTCLVRRIIQERGLLLGENYLWLSGLQYDFEVQLEFFFKNTGEVQLWVFDDIHLVSEPQRIRISRHMAHMSNAEFFGMHSVTCILIGIPSFAESLLLETGDLGRRLDVYRMRLASDDELHRLLEEGQRRLGVEFEYPYDIVREAKGSFHLCQEICRTICWANGINETVDYIATLSFKIETIRRRIISRLSQKFWPMIADCSKQFIETGSVNPFHVVIAALARLRSLEVTIESVVEQAGPFGHAVLQHRHEIMPAIKHSHGNLQRLLYYDDKIGVFSIEDPMFGYYLEHIDLERTFPGLGGVRMNAPASTINRMPEGQAEVVPAPLHCKLLFVAANPHGTSQLALDQEYRNITEKIRAAEYRDRFEVLSRWAIQPDDLLQVLNESSPQIVHFSGHGDATGGIVLASASGKIAIVSSEALAALFKIFRSTVQLVVLNACFTDKQAKALAESVGCAVGMSGAVTDREATVFAASLYRAIGFGCSVQEAFSQANAALLLEGISSERPHLVARADIDPSQLRLLPRA